MGCDIHLAVERRKRDATGRAGSWERVAIVPEHARDPWYVEQAVKYPTAHYPKYAEREWYHDRNYGVFAILANVRNYEDATPIAEPRGLPDDLCDELRHGNRDGEDVDFDETGGYWLGDHSHSWLTLTELQTFPWYRDAQTTGCVTFEEFLARIVKHGSALPVRVEKHPYGGWCGDIGGPNIVVREAADVLAALRDCGLARPVEERTYVRDVWLVPASVDAGSFTSRLMPALAELGDPDDVRIVFGFDS